MMLGIIGEYVGRTLLAGSGKPQGAVRLTLRSANPTGTREPHFNDKTSSGRSHNGLGRALHHQCWRRKRPGAFEAVGEMTAYWVALFCAVLISMLGQTLLKAAANLPSFAGQLLDWRTLSGLVLLRLVRPSLYGGVATDPHVGRPAVNGGILRDGGVYWAFLLWRIA